MEELNLLEHYFLENIDYNIYINPEEYKLCSKYLYDSVKLLMKDEEIVSNNKNKIKRNNKSVNDTKEIKEMVFRNTNNLSTASSSFKSLSSKLDFSSNTSKK